MWKEGRKNRIEPHTVWSIIWYFSVFVCFSFGWKSVRKGAHNTFNNKNCIDESTQKQNELAQWNSFIFFAAQSYYIILLRMQEMELPGTIWYHIVCNMSYSFLSHHFLKDLFVIYNKGISVCTVINTVYGSKISSQKRYPSRNLNKLPVKWAFTFASVENILLTIL